MSSYEALLLGILQGLTEFLPVSSSGHLVLVEHLMGLTVTEFLFFDVLLHIATLIAVCIYFRARIIAITTHLLSCARGQITEQARADLHLAGALLLSTLITATIGITLKLSGVMNAMRADLLPIGLCFIVTGLLLLSTLLSRAKVPEGENAWPMNLLLFSVIMGLAQSFAILPGISRSGATICMALLLGTSKERAVEYSFLMSIPAIIGAMLVELKDAEFNITLIPAVAGFIASLVSGIIFLWMLVWLVRGGKLYQFAFYVIPLGIWVIWSAL